MKDIFIGIFTGLLLTIFVFAMITEADAKTTTNTDLMRDALALIGVLEINGEG